MSIFRSNVSTQARPLIHVHGMLSMDLESKKEWFGEEFKSDQNNLTLAQ